MELLCPNHKRGNLLVAYLERLVVDCIQHGRQCYSRSRFDILCRFVAQYGWREQVREQLEGKDADAWFGGRIHTASRWLMYVSYLTLISEKLGTSYYLRASYERRN